MILLGVIHRPILCIRLDGLGVRKICGLDELSPLAFCRSSHGSRCFTYGLALPSVRMYQIDFQGHLGLEAGFTARFLPHCKMCSSSQRSRHRHPPTPPPPAPPLRRHCRRLPLAASHHLASTPGTEHKPSTQNRWPGVAILGWLAGCAVSVPATDSDGVPGWEMQAEFAALLSKVERPC